MPAKAAARTPPGEMAAIQARALTAPIVAQPAQLSMKLSFCTEFAPARRGTAYAPQSAGYRGITDAGDSRAMRHEMHGRQALRPDRHHVASGRLGSVEQCGTSEGVSVIADVAAVVALDLRDAGIVVHGDDADRHVGLDLAHDAAVTQRVDRNLARVAKLFPIGQPASLNDLLERPVMVGLLPRSAVPPTDDRLNQASIWTTTAQRTSSLN